LIIEETIYKQLKNYIYKNDIVREIPSFRILFKDKKVNEKKFVDICLEIITQIDTCKILKPKHKVLFLMIQDAFMFVKNRSAYKFDEDAAVLDIINRYNKSFMLIKSATTVYVSKLKNTPHFETLFDNLLKNKYIYLSGETIRNIYSNKPVRFIELYIKDIQSEKIINHIREFELNDYHEFKIIEHIVNQHIILKLKTSKQVFKLVFAEEVKDKYFTIDSLLYDITSGKLIDPYGCLLDLVDNNLRFIKSLVFYNNAYLYYYVQNRYDKINIVCEFFKNAKHYKIKNSDKKIMKKIWFDNENSKDSKKIFDTIEYLITH